MKKYWIGAIILVLIIAGVWYAQSSDAPETATESYGDNESATQNSSDSTSETNTFTPKEDEKVVVLETSMGNIEIALAESDAPKTTANFLKLVGDGFYDGVIFHRVIAGFMIQGGDPTGTGTGGPGYQFEDELNAQTESYKLGYVKGTVAMANAGPDTNGSQFFIMHQDYRLPHNYTIFGHVVSGQDVVDKIAIVATDDNDKPLIPVTIKKAYLKGN